MKLDKQAREATWKKHVIAASRHSSGDHAYCRDHDLNYPQFFYWRNKFRSQVSVSSQALVAAPSFLPVQVAPQMSDSARDLPNAEWLGRFAAELVRGLGQ